MHSLHGVKTGFAVMLKAWRVTGPGNQRASTYGTCRFCPLPLADVMLPVRRQVEIGTIALGHSIEALMRCFSDMGCAYVRLVCGLLIMEFTKQSDHEVTIQDLKRQGDVLVRVPRYGLSIVWCILCVPLNFFPVLLDVGKHDDPAMVPG